MNWCNNEYISIAVSMATNVLEVSDKYFVIMTWNITFCIRYVGFLLLYKYVARECVAMVTNHIVTF